MLINRVRQRVEGVLHLQDRDRVHSLERGDNVGDADPQRLDLFRRPRPLVADDRGASGLQICYLRQPFPLVGIGLDRRDGGAPFCRHPLYQVRLFLQFLRTLVAIAKQPGKILHRRAASGDQPNGHE